MDYFISVLFAFAGGILPAMIWLYFWLEQDSDNPEPRKLIFLTFFFGMLTVPFAYVGQLIIREIFIGKSDLYSVFSNNYTLAIITIVLWATIEEVVKYSAAYFGGLSQKSNDEPVDPIVYMITAALGFAALENTLYIFKPIFYGYTETALMTGNMRFIGATLLHISSSAMIGLCLAFSYYKNDYLKKRYLITGLVLSVLLHSVFNSFIIRSGIFGLIAFCGIWLVIILIILSFEKIKQKIKK
jgi:RsiW-degrading membrane proteinase PrsW (M82 family)